MDGLTKHDIDRLADALMCRMLGTGNGWNMSALTYSEADSIIVLPNCFAIMFTNVGDTLAVVNGMRIFPSATPTTALGDSRSISGHKLDLYVGNLNLAFENIQLAPLVEIVQLFYHPMPFELSQL